MAKSEPTNGFVASVHKQSGLSDIVRVDEVTGNSFIGESDARRNGWLQTSALIIADVIGTGVLSIGGAFASFGPLVGTLFFVVFTPFNYLTGWLLNRVHLQHPTCVTLGDAARTVLGHNWGIFSYTLTYIYLGFLIADYAGPLSLSVQCIVNFMPNVCKPTACAVACVIMLPFIQLRTLHNLALLSAVSFFSIFGVLVISAGFLLATDSCSETEIPALDFPGVFNGMGNFVFAFAGQTIFLEMNAEMKNPRQFPQSLNFAYVIMVVVYYSLSMIAYQRCGAKTPQDSILLVVPNGAMMTVVGVFMLVHMMISYTISSTVLTRGLMLWSGKTQGLENSIRGRIIWACTTFAFLLVAQVIANAVPKFSTMNAFISAFATAPLCFLIPCTLFLMVDRKKPVERRSGVALKGMIWATIVVFAAYWVIGTYFAVKAFFDKGSGAFACNTLDDQRR